MKRASNTKPAANTTIALTIRPAHRRIRRVGWGGVAVGVCSTLFGQCIAYENFSMAELKVPVDQTKLKHVSFIKVTLYKKAPRQPDARPFKFSDQVYKGMYGDQ